MKNEWLEQEIDICRDFTLLDKTQKRLEKENTEWQHDALIERIKDRVETLYLEYKKYV